jgi:hypothetical protein
VSYGTFAAITSDAAGYAQNGTIAFWFYDMSENFCKMTAVLKGNQITSFTISDPYSMCSYYPLWKTAQAFSDGTGEVVAFTGPKGVKYLVYNKDELYVDADHS